MCKSYGSALVSARRTVEVQCPLFTYYLGRYLKEISHMTLHWYLQDGNSIPSQATPVRQGWTGQHIQAVLNQPAQVTKPLAVVIITGRGY